MHSAILNETIAAVTDILGRDLDSIAVERAVIGLFFTGVKLSAGPGIVAAGTCATPRDEVPGEICCPVSARAASALGGSPGRLAGRPAAELMQQALAGSGLSRAVGIATLNALAELCWRRRPHPGMDLLPGMDAFEATELHASDKVVLVGAFIPFLKELKRRRQPYLVLERNPAMLKPEELPFYRPAEAAAEVVPAADVLLITGSTLLTDTLEDLLALARPAGAGHDRRPDRRHAARPVPRARRRYPRRGAHHPARRIPRRPRRRRLARRISSAVPPRRSCSPASPPCAAPRWPEPGLSLA